MQIIQEIGLQVIEILTLIFGILGMTFSVMLLLSPNMTKNLSRVLNRSVNIDQKIGLLDKEIEITNYVYNHNIVLGLVLIAGSAFSLFFFFFSLDVEKFTGVFWGSQDYMFLAEITIPFIIWIGKVACMAGLAAGLLLIFAPGSLKRLETKLNYWFDTKAMIEKLDLSSHELDSFFFRHPIMMGLTGAVISFFILSLSIINFLIRN
jgi:hypothetical protein